MEISWRWSSFCYSLLIYPLCNAHPSNLEGIVADQQTQFLTGLIGVVLIVCSLIFLAVCLCCQKRNNFKEFRDSPVVATVPAELDHGHVNPIANGEFTIFTPLSPPTINNNVFLPREQIVSSKLESYVYEGTDLSHWFDDTEKDFPRIKLKYVKELGQGKFGKVVEGAAQGIFEDENQWTPVVVRILDSNSNHEEKLLFLKDALMYRCEPHPNILSLYGRCLETVPFLLLQEYCQNDLKAYLRYSSTEDKNISTRYLLWSTQLISALKHLHKFNFIHPDLACRNCLLTEDLNIKLGDYTLSKSKYPSDYYRGNPSVPIRWIDPESVEIQDNIQLKKLTPANNIWSLGVTLWEICQCGDQPYSNLTDDEVILQVLRSNLRLQKPFGSALYVDNLYRIIQSCWNSIESRPNINQIDAVLFEIIEGHMTQTSDASSFSSDDFDKKWESLRPNSISKTDRRADSISIEMTDNDIRILNPLSPSKGSLNNLLIEKPELHVEFKLEDERSHRGVNESPPILEEVICSDSSDQGSAKVESSFIFGERVGHDARNFVYQRTSSGSETEDENWRKKVERGAYTEKVRMKSRSVADLMILTHVDYSESESETPLPSLDFRVNYKNVRSALDNGHTFGSEGNLLSIQDTFQEELKKLQEERKDSLLFVPDSSNKSSSSSRNVDVEKDSIVRDVNTLANSSKLLRELSSPERIQPSNQVYNVFNVSVENASPLYNNSKFQGIINLNSPFKFETEVVEAKMHEPNRNSDSFKIIDPFKTFSCDNVKSFSDKSVLNVKCDQQSSIASLDNVENRPFQGQINVENEFTTNSNNPAQVETDTGQIGNNLNTPEPILAKDLRQQCQNNNMVGNKSRGDCLDCEHSEFQAANHSLDTVKVLTDDADEEIDTVKSDDTDINETLFENPANELPDFNNHTQGQLNEVFIEEQPICTEENSKLGDFFEFSQVSDNTINDISTNNTIVDVNSIVEVTPNVEDDKSVSKPEESLKEISLKLSESENVDVLKENCDTSNCLEQPLTDLLADDVDECVEKDKNESSNPSSLSDIKIDEESEVPQTEITKELPENNRTDKNVEQLNNLSSPDDHSSYEFLSCEGNADNDLCNTSESLYSVLDQNEFDPVRSDKDSILETCDNLKDEHLKVNNETCLELDHDELVCTESQSQGEKENKTESLQEESKETKENMGVEEQEYLDECGKEEKIVTTESLQEECNETKEEGEYVEEDTKQEVKFDLSADQDEAMPNSLTHSCAFNSTPMRKKAIPVSIEDAYSSINLFNVTPESDQPTEFSSEFVTTGQDNKKLNENLSYSLETWDSFLNKTLNTQSHDNMFDSFSSEPKSLLFVENADVQAEDVEENVGEDGSNEESQLDKTFTIEPKEGSCEDTLAENDDLNSTYTKEHADVLGSEDSHEISWESAEGWFIHPQTSEDVSGEMQISTSTTDSYVGFGLDDEIMSAIRNELLSKLPHAQGSNVDRMKDESLLDSQETNEVFLRYNVYNTPLSPIPEESFVEDGSGSNTPKQPVEEDEDSDWSEHYEGPQDTESHSTRTLEGISRGPLHRHTPSQDSCCSNDTLFNLEELNFATAETEKEDEEMQTKEVDDFEQNDCLNSTYTIETTENKLTEEIDVLNEEKQPVASSALVKMDTLICQQSLKDFLLNERQHSSNDAFKLEKQDHSGQDNFVYNKAQAVPLPSPENNPWKQLPVSLSCNMPPSDQNEHCYVNSVANESQHLYENNFIENAPIDGSTEPDYANCERGISPECEDKDYNNYVNLINMENAKNSLESTDSDKDYVNIDNFNTESGSDENIFGILTDIRFNGPTDNQLMSTSFSESNNDEQEWDSGSDSRSSSSGEFIWKEGDNQEFLKVLRAAPQDLKEIKLMENIIEEDQFGESDISSIFSDDDEGETPEFIPSAWDKFAMPRKSALRSPEKTLNKSEDKKAKVWFKKQKYHCIYEYPKEPESPVLQSQDLWKPQTDFKMYTDWEFDGEPYAATTDDSDNPLDFEYKPNNATNNKSLYQLTDVSDFMPGNTGLDDAFFISGSSQPFSAGSSSQFFPGSSKWGYENILTGSIENATPDSGVEDITPGSQTDRSEYTKIERSVPTLKQLASTSINKSKQSNIRNEDVLGGLRHTRNKLKLDLPPSPSAFTNEKVFVVENNNPEPLIREKPTFTTFGKSRFLVQHIDTPEDESQGRNVSFEALPYKPLADTSKKESQEIEKNNDLNLSSCVSKKDSNNEESDVVKLKIEIVRGEASLLDSADEDSGIESSTLERKLSNV